MEIWELESRDALDFQSYRPALPGGRGVFRSVSEEKHSFHGCAVQMQGRLVGLATTNAIHAFVVVWRGGHVDKHEFRS